MTDDRYAVILVRSTSHAIRIEKLLGEATIPCKLIPVPRQISSDCGVCVRILRADTQAVCQAIEASGIEIEGIHEIERKGK